MVDGFNRWGAQPTRRDLALGAGACLAAALRPAAANPRENPLPSPNRPAWHLFWVTGNAPRRQIYLIDVRHKQVGPDVYETQAATLLETPRADVEHWAGTLQLQASDEQIRQVRGDVRKAMPLMKDLRVRTLSSYLMGGDGSLKPSGPSDWAPFKTPIDLLTLRIASDPNAIRNLQAHNLVFVGSFFRAIDAVDVMRKLLPNVRELKAGG